MRLLRALLRRGLGSWQRAEAASALAAVLVWLLAIAAAFSVVLGDVRALVGSVGLFGLALSWALQTPIESFTGWLLNSFRGYYRVGDRITVGPVHGDVHRIDILTTTVWETGGPGSAVKGQSGALVTFPNLEVLRSNIVNYTLDFPFVWNETTIGITGESDTELALRVVGDVAMREVGEAMAGPAAEYQKLLRRAGLDPGITERPQVFLSAGESYTNVTVRYLVPVRERRPWATRLLSALARELSRPEYRGRVTLAVPRVEVDLLEEGSGSASSAGDV